MRVLLRTAIPWVASFEITSRDWGAEDGSQISGHPLNRNNVSSQSASALSLANRVRHLRFSDSDHIVSLQKTLAIKDQHEIEVDSLPTLRALRRHEVRPVDAAAKPIGKN